jgi:hypothetical protein
MTSPGIIRYADDELPFAGVMAVATSRVARGQGLAARTTALALQRAAAAGAAASGLGIFDQGFYDKLGFGTLGYVVATRFDPSGLRIPQAARPPLRLTEDDLAELHANRNGRMRVHGSVVFDHRGVTKAELAWAEGEGFFLGYREGNRITHHLYAGAKSESGPYTVVWMAYETGEQLLELLALLKGLGDQVHQVRMLEPPQLQLQDLLHRPLRSQGATDGAKLAHRFSAAAETQIRILDLVACTRVVTVASPVAMNLIVTDPAAAWLPGTAAGPGARAPSGWRGIGGHYVWRLGPQSTAEPGRTDPALPTLTASAGALSRLWIGARPASSLALTDELQAPASLLAALDEALRPPSVPRFDWMF